MRLTQLPTEPVRDFIKAKGGYITYRHNTLGEISLLKGGMVKVECEAPMTKEQFERKYRIKV